MKRPLALLASALAVGMLGFATAWWVERGARERAVSDLVHERRARRAAEEGARLAEERLASVARREAAVPAPSGATSRPSTAPAPAPAVHEKATPPPAASQPSSGAPAEESLDVDVRDPGGEIARLLPLLRDRVKLPFRKGGEEGRELVRATLGKLLAGAPGETLERLEAAARVETSFGLFWQLLDLLRERDPAASARVVRDSLDAPDALVKDNARASIAFLPEAEALAVWRRLLADKDPALRATAIGYPPGASPEIDRAARDAALREQDAKAKGEALLALFGSRPTAENLAVVVDELRRDRRPDFRAALLAFLPRHLTARDASAVAVLQEIARDEGETAAIRKLAIQGLVNGGPSIDGLLPAPEKRALPRIGS